MQRASRVVDRRGEGGMVCWKREFEVRFAAPAPTSPPRSSRCVISMPYGTNVDTQVFDNTHSSFLYYRSVSIGHPSIRSPFTRFFFFFFLFFSIGIYRVVFSFCTPVDARRGSWISGISVQRYHSCLSHPLGGTFFIHAAMTARVYVDRHNGRFMASGLDI